MERSTVELPAQGDLPGSIIVHVRVCFHASSAMQCYGCVFVNAGEGEDPLILNYVYHHRKKMTFLQIL